MTGSSRGFGTHAVHCESRRQKLVGATPWTVHWRQSARPSISSSRGRCKANWNPAGWRESSWVAATRATRSSSARLEFAEAFRRRVPESRWSREEYNTFLGVPWNPRGLHVEAPVASGRRRYITKSIVAERGPTPGCPACVGASSTHTASCRARFEEIFAGLATRHSRRPRRHAWDRQRKSEAVTLSAGLHRQDHSATSCAGLQRAGEEQRQPESKQQAVPNVADVMVEPLGETATASDAWPKRRWTPTQYARTTWMTTTSSFTSARLELSFTSTLARRCLESWSSTRFGRSSPRWKRSRWCAENGGRRNHHTCNRSRRSSFTSERTGREHGAVADRGQAVRR